MTSGSLGAREEGSMLPQKFYQDPSCPTTMPPGGLPHLPRYAFQNLPLPKVASGTKCFISSIVQTNSTGYNFLSHFKNDIRATYISINILKEAHNCNRIDCVNFPPSYSMQSAMSPMSSSAMNSYNSFSTNNMMSSSISAAM